MRPEDRANRLALGVLGVVLLAGGVAGLARGFGSFGTRAARQPVLWDDLRRFADDNESAFWSGALVVALVVAWLSWRWLRAQLRTAPALAEAELAPASPEGRPTSVRAGALTAAVTDDVASHSHVLGARARLAPAGDPFTLHLTVTVADGARVDEVRDHIGRTVLPRLRRALEVDQLETRVRFDTGPPTERVVR